MGPLGEVPFVEELLMLIAEISTPIKIAWALCLIWSVVQIVWFRRGRAVPAMLPVAAVRRSSAVVTPAVVQSAARMPARPSTLRAGGSPEFLAALGLEEAAPAPASGSVYR